MKLSNSDRQFDIIIIGAGVIGCAAARSLASSGRSILVIEKESDVGFGISCRNSGVVHSGIHYHPGTNRARHGVAGNAAMEDLCKELHVPFEKSGKLTVAFTKEQETALQKLLDQGMKNGVPDLRILSRDEMESLQPGISGTKALYSPTTSIISPYEFTIALAESAYANGVEFLFTAEVTAIEQEKGASSHYTITANQLTEGTLVTFSARIVINAAGLFSADIARMAGIDEYTIYPCRGEYFILDKRLQDQLNLLIYPVPGADSSGLGIHLTNTVGGVILIGPSQEYIEDPENTATTKEMMAALKQEGHALLSSLETTDFIRSFSGIRPKLAPPEEGGFRDFVIESREDLPGFINLTGIESPGLTSAPSIAEEIRSLVSKLLPLKEQTDFIHGRPGIKGVPFSTQTFRNADRTERAHLIEKNPDYGTIVCRCETVTLAEIKEAVARTLGPVTLAGIKYRTRAGMGRCQGGFCLQRLSEILQHEFSIPPEKQTLKGPGTELFPGTLRDEGAAGE